MMSHSPGRADAAGFQPRHRACLNLVVSAIVHWNTVYLDRAVTHLRKARRTIVDDLLKHVSPLSWEHVNLTGIRSTSSSVISSPVRS
jgi:hypothetical protein